ncbi:hypothetical protein EXIGLDRAFT_172901 [Exidia glandulosa HHB12029]|uniref:Uncharacterized protein n=1 Tax=Exidia glandulosa HHB12029 TaxID=1314781 RepID=A0A165F9I6_EXIGL|nr:hypothetical protein EXIGLDRAFT_172901 [Exidia glandulosa HHB12029]
MWRMSRHLLGSPLYSACACSRQRLQEDLQPVSRPYALRAKQHKNIIRSCNEELDRCTRDLSLWADLLLIRDVESLRTSVLEAIAAVGGQVDDLSRRSPALASADLQASEATVLQAISVLSSRVDESLSQGPTAPRQVTQQVSNSKLHLSACLGDFSVQIEASPKSCVLFA